MDFLAITNTDLWTNERRKRFRCATDAKSVLGYLLGLLQRNRYNPFAVGRNLYEQAKTERILEEQNALLLADRTRSWNCTDLINYVRAGDRVSVVNESNADRYLTWLNETTLNGVVMMDYLSRRGYEGELVQTFGFGSEERLERLLSKEPSCVIVSTTFILLDRISALGEIREMVRRISPRTKVVVGGSSLHWCVKTYPELVPYVLDFCDAIIDDAQGFGTLCRLIERLKRGEELEDLPNLIYSRRGRMIKTQREPERISINELAPDWTRWIPRNYKGRVRLQTSQGCPCQCRFCDFRLRNRTEYKSLDVLRKELQALSSLGVAKLDFIDDLFTLPEKRLRSICRMMLDEKFDFRWFCLSRSSGLSADTVRLMAEAGCEMVNIGMESAAPEILRNMDKRTNVEESYVQLEEFRRHDITVFCNFILGFPGETDETIGQTLHFLNTAAIDAYFLVLFISTRGTRADAQEFRKEFKLKGEYLGWRHATGSASEFAGKMNDFVSRVSSRVLRVGGLEEVCMLLDDGYTPTEMKCLALIVKGLAEWKRGNGIRPEDKEKSLNLLEKLKAFEETRRQNDSCTAGSGDAKIKWRRTSSPAMLSGTPKL